MEQAPQHHREGMQDLMDKAHEEALRDDAEMEDKEEIERYAAMVRERREFKDAIQSNRVEALKLPEMEGKTIVEVAAYVKEKYGDEYDIPGEEFRDFLRNIDPVNHTSTRKDKFPESLLNSDYEYFFLNFNSTFKEVPVAEWSEDDMDHSRKGILLAKDGKAYSIKWDEDFNRAVLIKKK